MNPNSLRAIFRSNRLTRALKRLAGSVQGSQIVELAVGLPFMMVVLVAIFDFGQAFNTKQKVNTAAREAARYAANQSTLDWSNPNAPTVDATRNVVDQFLVNANLNDCGLMGASPSYDAGTHTWTYTSNGSCPLPIKVTIQRADVVVLSNGTNMIATKVSITYPIQWHFSSVVKLIVPGSNYPGPAFTITSSAVMANLT